MKHFINGIVGILGTLFSVAGILYIYYSIIKNGFKFWGIIGLFVTLSVCAYLVRTPSQVIDFGGFIISSIKAIARGDM